MTRNGNRNAKIREGQEEAQHKGGNAGTGDRTKRRSPKASQEPVAHHARDDCVARINVNKGIADAQENGRQQGVTMSVKKGLGKGLDSLITDKVNTKPAASKNNPTPKSEHAADAIMMNITKVEPNREQPRKKFDEDALLELAESIKQYGVLQPLLVQEREDYYEIVAGERRWRAAKIAGIKEIPVIIKKLTRQEIMEISLIENIQREDLNPIEEALAFKRLLTEFNLKQDEVAERVSKSRTAVTNAMRLLKLNEKVQQMVIDEMLTTGHARALLGIEDQEQQYIIAQKIFDEKLSVRDTEKLVKSLQNEKKKKKEEKEKIDPKLEAVYHDLEEQMKGILGTKVCINHKDAKKGKLEIEYYSQDELDRIIDMIRTIQK